MMTMGGMYAFNFVNRIDVYIHNADLVTLAVFETR